MSINKKTNAMKFLDKVIGKPMTLGSVLESLRLSDEETQSSYAKKLGISQTHLSQIETGVKVVSPERAKRFAKILGHSEVVFVQLAMQDMLSNLGIKMTVTLKAA